jgi:hypothetical protein
MCDQPVLLECAVVEVTTIREGHEFEDLDYLDEEEGIEKLKDAKGNFILWPRKDILLKICSTPIVSPQTREDEISKYNTQHCLIYSSMSKSSANYPSSRKSTIYTTS